MTYDQRTGGAGYLRQHLFGEHAGVAGAQLFAAAYRDFLALAFAVLPELALDGEGLSARADHDEEAADFGVTHHVLALVRRWKTADDLVIQGDPSVAHGRRIQTLRRGSRRGWRPRSHKGRVRYQSLRREKINSYKGLRVLQRAFGYCLREA